MNRSLSTVLFTLALTLSAQEVRIPDGLLHQEVEGSLGLESIPATHKVLYDASKESYRFCHHPNLVLYKGVLYAMWSNGIAGEDENGQRVLWTSSKDGETWSKPEVLVADPDGDGPLNAVAAGFHVNGDTLVAYYSAVMDKKSIYPGNSLYAITTRDLKKWSKPHKIVEGFFIENPRRLPSGRILMNGQFNTPSTRLMYTDSPDGITGWKDAAVPALPDFDPRYPEPNWYLRQDKSIVMLFRAVNSVPWLYSSVSRDNGESYTVPQRTNLPSATARMAVGNLPDGRAFCIWNPSQKFGRIPLVLALSRDGKVFDRAWVLRGEPTKQRFEGERKGNGWQYPNALIWKDSLWVIYSVNKEDVVISRIRLNDVD
jgi:hypothetical protein